MTLEHDGKRLPEPAHDMSRPTPHHHVPYVWIFGILVVLTAVTVVAGIIHPESILARVFVALLIASVKGAFVALFFMHLKFEGKLIYLILITPLILCIILVVALIPDTRPTVLFAHPYHEAAAEATGVEPPILEQ